MPLRVRVATTTTDVTAALEWLAMLLTFATTLYQARVDTEKDDGSMVSILFTFPSKANGDRFLKLVQTVTTAPLVGTAEPILTVDSA